MFYWVLCRCFYRIPAPWRGDANSDNTATIRATAAKLHEKAGVLPKSIFGDPLSRSMFTNLHLKFPAIIINLDARYDRWLSCLRECALNGLAGVRLSAVDAKKTRFVSNMTSSNIIEEKDSIVSTDLVSKTWDSTLNATFDRTTTVSKMLPITPSERACAASHVLAWKVAFLSSLWYGDGSMRPLPRESESRLNTAPPVSLNSPRTSRTDMRDDNAELDDEDIKTFSSLFNHSQWINGYYLIMEDDIEINQSVAAVGDSTEFLVKVSNLCKVLPEDTDICYLGYIMPKGAKVRHGKMFIKPSYLWQLHAYLLSPSGARKLLSNLPVNAPVDNFIAGLIYEEKLTVCAFYINR